MAIDDLIFSSGPRPHDPISAARKGGGPMRARRVWRDVTVRPTPGGYEVCLDGKPARTPARAPLVLPTPAAAALIAAEWQAVGETFDPRELCATRIANAAIDHVAPRRAEVTADIVRYAEADLVLYRAEEPERLVALQGVEWDPVVAFAAGRYGAHFRLAKGVVHTAQPQRAIAAIRAAASAVTDPLALAALHVLTTISGSVLIALAVAERALEAPDAFAKAELDADFQASVWGRDAEAMAARARREREFLVASELLAALP